MIELIALMIITFTLGAYYEYKKKRSTIYFTIYKISVSRDDIGTEWFIIAKDADEAVILWRTEYKRGDELIVNIVGNIDKSMMLYHVTK